MAKKSESSDNKNEMTPEELVALPLTTPAPLSALQKMRRVNSLTGCLSNNNFLLAIKNLEEGEYILGIIASAIETELENMFQGGAKAIEKTNFAGLTKSIDVAYGKAQALANSPLQQVLEQLLSNLGGQSAPARIESTGPVMNSEGRHRGELMGF